MIHRLSAVRDWPQPAAHSDPVSCEHRTVSRDGRIICAKISEGDNAVSPALCRACPFQAVDCAHLRFSLQHTAPRPLVVRYNGRTEIWDDEPPALHFCQAACAARVMPIDHPRACAGCTLRQALQAPAAPPPRRLRRAACSGKVVPFPERQPLPAG
jgi:hypothetical protein